MKRGEIWISAIIYVLVAVAVMVLVLEAGIPMMKGMKEKSAFTKIRTTVTALDQHIEDIASEGQGSQRVIPIEVNDGELRFENDRLLWKLETESKVVEPRTRAVQGNLVIASDVDVSATQDSYHHILQNTYILANFTRFGSSANWSTSINESAILNYIEFKDNNARTDGLFSFAVNGTSLAATSGYTELEETGTGLTSGVLRAHMNSTSFEYDIVFTLESKADFLKVAIENFVER